MTSDGDPGEVWLAQQLRKLQREAKVARQERNVMRDELRALKRYVAILVQANLEREQPEPNVLVLQNPINAETLVTWEGGRNGEENTFRDEWTGP